MLVGAFACAHTPQLLIRPETEDRDLGWLDAQATLSMSADGRHALIAPIGEWSRVDGTLQEVEKNRVGTPRAPNGAKSPRSFTARSMSSRIAGKSSGA